MPIFSSRRFTFNEIVDKTEILSAKGNVVVYHDAISAETPFINNQRDPLQQDCPLTNRPRRDVMLVAMTEVEPDPKLLKELAEELDLRSVHEPWKGELKRRASAEILLTFSLLTGEKWYPADFKGGLMSSLLKEPAAHPLTFHSCSPSSHRLAPHKVS